MQRGYHETKANITTEIQQDPDVCDQIHVEADQEVMEMEVTSEPLDSTYDAVSEHASMQATEFSNLADEYRVKYSEMLSQEPNSLKEEETQPSWLVEHLQGIRNNLEGELIKIHEDVNNAFELSTDEKDSFDDLLAKEMVKIHLSDDSEENNENSESEPLYAGSSITVGISALLIMTLVIRHSLSGDAVNDILTLLSFHCMGSSFNRYLSSLKVEPN